MARLIITEIRDDTTKPWIVVTPESTHSDLYTSAEIDILKLTMSAIHSLPGYEGASHSFPDDKTHILTMQFDTLLNAQNAQTTLDNPEPNSLFDLRRTFLINKRSSLGIRYNVTLEAIE